MRDILAFIVVICVIFAAMQGVTFNGNTYTIETSDERGLELKEKQVK